MNGEERLRRRRELYRLRRERETTDKSVALARTIPVDFHAISKLTVKIFNILNFRFELDLIGETWLTTIPCTVSVPDDGEDKTSDTYITTCMHTNYQSFMHAQALHSNQYSLHRFSSFLKQNWPTTQN